MVYQILRSLRLESAPLLLPPSFHASYEYGMRAPLQSKNDIDRIEPFKRNTGPPVHKYARQKQQI